MACPTCTHTLQRLSDTPAWWWCPRCGTVLRAAVGQMTHTGTPNLVERVRDLHARMTEKVGFHAWDVMTWHQLGLFEAIYEPEDRPK